MKKASRSSGRAGRSPGTKKTTATKVKMTSTPVAMMAGFADGSVITLYLDDSSISTSSDLTPTVTFTYTDGSGVQQTVHVAGPQASAYDQFASVTFTLNLNLPSLPLDGSFTVELTDASTSITGTLSARIYPSS